MAKAKITVLKRMVNEDLIDEYLGNEMGPCALFEDGQEFAWLHSQIQLVDHRFPAIRFLDPREAYLLHFAAVSG